MENRAFREILIFVVGTTPQIVTETLYGLTQECVPPVIPDEIHIITTARGKQTIEEELIAEGRLQAFYEEFRITSIPLDGESIHLVQDEESIPLDDIRNPSHNEAIGDFIADFLRKRRRMKYEASLFTGGRAKDHVFLFGFCPSAFWKALGQALSCIGQS